MFERSVKRLSALILCLAGMACGDDDAHLAGVGSEPSSDGGTEWPPIAGGSSQPPIVDPGRVKVQAFSLPTRAAVSNQTFEITEPFPSLRFDDAIHVVEQSGRFYVVEWAGRIYSFNPRDRTPEKRLILDISEQVIAAKDSGMIALAFHPDFGKADSENRGYFYVYYAHTEDKPETIESSRIAHDIRLSRFTIEDGEQLADPSSELVLISQRDRHLWHQGGGLLFGPDGFLYLAIGDEGGYDCTFKRCQRNDSLFGGVLRIDVDMRGEGISHPIPRQPPDGVTDHYFIPDDNPFVDDPGAMEEMFAIGLRNPYRMTYDPIDGQIWIGDVGESLQEEIDVLSRGANYQWDMIEGETPVDAPSDPTLPQLGEWTAPVHAYKRSEMRAIVMGPVYRGSALPALYGKVLHIDFVRGTLRAASYAFDDDDRVVVTDIEIIAETPLVDVDGGATTIMAASDGRIYLTSYGADRPMFGLEEAPVIGDAVPDRLSETKLFDDLETLEPADGLYEYEVNVALWSDGSRKRRFVAIPDGKTVRYTERGAWELPIGTVMVKHFGIALDERKPEELHRLETRVIVVEDDSVYGATYKWRADQRDADLVLEHLEDELTVIDADGDERKQTHIYPSPSECVRCHHSGAGDALGISTRQLNREVGDENQLRALHQLDLVSELPEIDEDDDFDELAQLTRTDDEEAPLEERVRSYLDANCSFCHGMSRLQGAQWDARFETPLEDAHIVDAMLSGETNDEALRVIAPGSPEHSQLYLRASSTDRDRRMPPLGSARPDAEFIELLEDWIESL
jgi:uncharacterized repeat protein (TIGR03806 family)